MTIKYRILVAPAITLLLLLISGGVAYQAISALSAALAEINGVRIAHMNHGVALTEKITDLHTDMFRLVSWYNAFDDATQNQMKDEIATQIASSREDLESWLTSPQLTAEEKDRLTSLLQQFQEYKTGTDDALFMIDLDINSALGSMRNVEALFQKMNASFDEFNQLQRTLSDQVFERVQADSERSLFINAALVLIALVVATTTALFTANRLLRQLGGEPADAVRIAREIAAGDLSKSYPNAPDGSLLESMSSMQASLRQMVIMLTDQAQALAQQAQQMSRSSQEVASSSDEQSRAAGSIAATVEELTASISSVFDNAREATNLSQNSGDQARTGSDIILRATHEMERISASVGKVSDNIALLGDSSEKISSVVTVIQSIAEQTNLLALNAAIEAARAGEQGRGFAVVADEVRGLAGRTAESTREIASMVNVIQESVTTAIASMQASMAQVQNGVQLASDANSSVTLISSAAEQALTAVNDITQSLREQTNATDEISVSIANIAEMSATNHHLAKESARQANALADISGEINVAIGQFRY